MISKKAITMQVLSMIMMSIFMVAIIIFGLNKLLDVQDSLSQEESLEIQREVTESLEYCENPLNSGGETTFEIEKDPINFVCVLGDSHGEYSSVDQLANQLADINETGDNVVLLSAGLNRDSGEYTIDSSQEVNIIDSFSAEYGELSETICWNDENTGTIEASVVCEDIK